jgi:hypothetical protein
VPTKARIKLPRTGSVASTLQQLGPKYVHCVGFFLRQRLKSAVARSSLAKSLEACSRSLLSECHRRDSLQVAVVVAVVVAAVAVSPLFLGGTQKDC